MLVTKANKKNNTIALAKVLYIHYLFRFCKNKKIKMWALINLDKKINPIILIYAL